MADAQDFGIRISQPGYDARTALDYQLSFSSSWPQISIVKEFTQSLSPTFDGTYTFPSITFTHNLGYFAFAMTWTKGQNYFSTNSTTVKHEIYNLTIYKDRVIYRNKYFSTTNPGDITVHVKVYGLDLTKAQAYPYKKPPVIAMPYDNSYGIKITKDGKRMDSTDMRDFVIHSRCQSPQVDSVNIGLGSKYAEYTNTSGYTNWAFGFGSFHTGGIITGEQYFVPAPTNATQAPPSLRINKDNTGASKPNYMWCQGVGGLSATDINTVIVVLRDPLFVAKQVNVTY